MFYQQPVFLDILLARGMAFILNQRWPAVMECTHLEVEMAAPVYTALLHQQEQHPGKRQEEDVLFPVKKGFNLFKHKRKIFFR